MSETFSATTIIVLVIIVAVLLYVCIRYEVEINLDWLDDITGFWDD